MGGAAWAASAASSINWSARKPGASTPPPGTDAQRGTVEVLLVTAGSPHDGNESAVPTAFDPLAVGRHTRDTYDSTPFNVEAEEASPQDSRRPLPNSASPPVVLGPGLRPAEPRIHVPWLTSLVQPTNPKYLSLTHQGHRHAPGLMRRSPRL